MRRSRRTALKAHSCCIEALEARHLYAVLQNPVNRFDVDNSGTATPLDALVVINAISRIRRNFATPDDTSIRFVDVNGDGRVAPLDALLVINAISRFSGPLSLAVSIDPVSDPNGNGVVLSDSVLFRGQTSNNARMRFVLTTLDAELKAAVNGARTVELVADDLGEFSLSAQLSFGVNRIQVDATSVLGHRTSATLEVMVGDVVADWNATLLNVVRDWTTLSNDPYQGRIVSSPPPIVAKNLAMIHVAMFDALNSFEGEFTPYITTAPPELNSSPIAASASAAYEVAKTLYPGQRELAEFQATLAESLAQVDDITARDKGIAFGKEVAGAGTVEPDTARCSSTAASILGVCEAICCRRHSRLSVSRATSD